MKWNLCSVNEQRHDGTMGSRGHMNAAHRGATAEQEDIPRLTLSSLMLESVVLTIWCRLAAQNLP